VSDTCQRQFGVARALARASLAVVALALAPAAGASGPATYDFVLANGGSTPWASFVLVGPAGTAFVGGATVGEITARCVAGQPDGLANEIECGPLSGAGIAPGARVVFAGTMSSAPGCGAAFQLQVSATGAPPFAPAGDATPTSGCAPSPPATLAAPTIHGKARVGRTLTASISAPAPVSYRWQRCTGPRCRAIPGATKRTLVLARADAGHSVRVVATASVEGSELTSESKPVAVAATTRAARR
jgi:hypothetical protein